MPRKRTGTVERRNGQLRMGVSVKVRVDDKTVTKRAWILLDSAMSDARAKIVARRFAEQSASTVFTVEQFEILKNPKKAIDAETVEEFFWNVYTREVTLHRYQLSYWRNHIMPILGSESVKTYGPKPLRKIVSRLDALVQSEKLQAGTARVVWSLARKFTRELAMSKNDKIRIREDNPASVVPGPDPESGRAKQWLYPSELHRVLAAETTSLALARFVAVQVYLCCRPGEAFGLEWRHIDFDAGIVRIDQTREPRTRVVGATKGREVRVFPIPQCLTPVLRAMRSESAGDGFLFDAFYFGKALRAAIKTAGVTRVELHETTARSRAFFNRFAKGEAHPSAKCNADTIRLIRQLHEERLSFAKIGARVGLHASTVHDIVHGKTWGHVA